MTKMRIRNRMERNEKPMKNKGIEELAWDREEEEYERQSSD